MARPGLCQRNRETHWFRAKGRGVSLPTKKAFQSWLLWKAFMIAGSRRSQGSFLWSPIMAIWPAHTGLAAMIVPSCVLLFVFMRFSSMPILYHTNRLMSSAT